MLKFLILSILFIQNVFAIVDGEKLDRNQFPNVVAITQFGTIFCSGVLIDSKTVLTAGHCVEGWSKEKVLKTMAVYQGEGKHLGRVEGQSSIKEVLIHKNYNKKRSLESLDEYDFALLVLEDEFEYVEEDIYAGDVNIGDQVVVTGYGMRNEYPRYVYENAFGVAYMGVGHVTETSDNEFKMGEGPSYSCNIDSGGPVYLKTVDGLQLLGTTSRGWMGCEQFTIYSRISNGLKNIEEGFIDLK